jgi:hypothetical protein
MLRASGAHLVGSKAQCPVHGLIGEHSVALSIAETVDDHRTLLKCHAGCAFPDVLVALGITRRDLTVTPVTPPARHAARVFRGVVWPPVKDPGTAAERGYRFESHHPYYTNVRKERLRHPTTGRSECRWERRNDHGEWVPGLPEGLREADMPMYRADDLPLAVGAGEPIVLCESESSVDALHHAGTYATTWAGGAGSVPVETIRAALGGYDRVIVIPDHDDAGRRALATLAEAGLAPHVLWPDEPGEDARDLLEHLGARELAARLAAALRDDDDVAREDPEEALEELVDEPVAACLAVTVTDVIGVADTIAATPVPGLAWLDRPRPRVPTIAPPPPRHDCPDCRRASAHDPYGRALCEDCQRREALVFEVTCAAQAEAFAALDAVNEHTPWCPLPRCDLPSRDQVRGGLCAVHYASDRAGHNGRGKFGNLVANAPGGGHR